jgi:folate-binding protein YgfZ
LPDNTKTFPSGSVHNIKNMTLINCSGKFSWCVAEKNTLKQYWETELNNSSWQQAVETMQYAVTIQHNLPLLSSKTSLTWTPAMIDWTRHDGVSFSKGCFVGQEIIARTHNLGKEKRHLYKIKLQKNSSSQQITSGSEIICANKKVMGKVVNYAITDDSIICLAVIEDRASQLSLYCEENIIDCLERCNNDA